MRVELADKAGFCFGVNRAVNTVYEQAEKKDKRIYTFGPIIHNEEVIRDLEGKGVHVIKSIEEAAQMPKGIIVIRSHGVSEAEQNQLIASGHEVVDATCPFVKKIHNLAKEYSEAGYTIVIVGSAVHPEVQGIIGWSHPDNTYIIESIEEAKTLKLPENPKVCVLSQTTFNYEKFKDIVEILRRKGYYIIDAMNSDDGFIVHNTICSATKERQEAATSLAKKVDAMIIIGGLSSSNSRKLYEICSENCLNTYFIQTKDDLINHDLSRFDYVGITAGASTPNNIIEEVQKYVRNEL